MDGSTFQAALDGVRWGLSFRSAVQPHYTNSYLRPVTLSNRHPLTPVFLPIKPVLHLLQYCP